MTEASITVLTVDLSTVPDSVWPRLEAVIDNGERARADDFRFQRHRRQHVAAHALKRLMLSPILGTPPQRIAFETGTFGKPEINPASGPHFNITHCDGLVACAVSLNHPVGVDAEPLNQPAPLAVADSFFTPDEQAWLASLSGEARNTGFFDLWTLKEAFIKATGRGLAQETRAFSVTVDPPSIRFLDPALGGEGLWRLHLARVEPHHDLAVAWMGPEGEPAIRPADWGFLFPAGDVLS